MTSSLFFSTIEVTRQLFYRTTLSYAIVNLKPIVPGHVLVCPARAVPRLGDLTQPELSDLMAAVQRVGNVVEKMYNADALTVACQDGRAAGQSIPHVHFHILPRKLQGDFFAERNDDVYPAIERAEGSLPHDFASRETGSRQHQPLKVDADEHRRPRTNFEMQEEATLLAKYFVEEVHA